jgi:hypothetical protein
VVGLGEAVTDPVGDAVGAGEGDVDVDEGRVNGAVGPSSPPQATVARPTTAASATVARDLIID